MENWLRDRLSNCLDFEIPDDMIKYILTLKDSNEFDAYFETLLDKECEDQKLFLADCRQRLFGKALPSKLQPVQHTPKQNQQNVTKNKKNDNNVQPTAATTDHVQQQGKKKTKFVNLYATDGKIVTDTILLKGRRPCYCEAAQHALINNCLSCGRIVCEQEGSGPCLFCGEIVCTNEEIQVLRASNKKSIQLLKSLKEKSGGGEGLKKALEQRDRLLEYERNSEKRTTVIDDELDYFQENSVWLSDMEREKLEKLKQEMHEKKHASRSKRTIKIDFAGRAIEDENQISAEYEQQVLRQISSAGKSDSSNWATRQHESVSAEEFIDPNLEAMRPLFRITKEGREFSKSTPNYDGLERNYNRVQDKELLEMQDMRHCLSMHQPWASLLVAGIKKHEGRVWYSEHRGRLWIAATAKEPRPEDIQDLENFYKNYYNDSNIKFPKHYPTGCLLGCVKVEDCMPQEEYRDSYPNGESDSPYVFVCSNPEQLPVVFPIKGEHKIYSIEPKIHNAACKMLIRLRTAKPTT